tara:strand:+ start:430 stop:1254 length:825 start_codon:yes stop_codon:yes gene_type:complete
MLKKIYRISTKFLYFSFFYFISPFIKIFKLQLYPDLSKINFFNFNYSNNTRRLVFDTKNKKSFNKVFIDTSLSTTKLCELGKKFPTTKSPIQLPGQRSGFTGVYSLLFSSLVNKKISLGEIGIEDNNSIKMWRNYFKKAKIYGFEFDDAKIKKAKRHKLNKTFIRKINVRSEKNIKESFKKTKTKFDIIIDDSTHIFEDQIRIVKNCYKFLNKNGILIIEDIYKYKKQYSEENYFKNLRKFKKYFNEIVFIDCGHVNNYTASWKNNKILLMTRK